MRRSSLQKIIYTIILLVMFFSCTSENYNEGIIEVDAYKNYPKLDLDLDDIAEISYIPLKLGKDTIFNNPSSSIRSFYITSDKIYLLDGSHIDPKIVVYNHGGEPLYTIGQKGRGPGEFFAPFCFTVDTISNEVFIWGVVQKKLFVYDTSGQFKRSTDSRFEFVSWTIDIINDSTIILFNPKALSIVPTWMSKGKYKVWDSGKTISFLNKKSLDLYDSPDINFERIYNENQTWNIDTLIKFKQKQLC